MNKYFACAVAVSVLGACGGGGGGGSSTPGSYNGLLNQGESLVEEWENTPYTTNAQIPTSGTATYRGVASYGDGSVLSSAQMQAYFSDSSISGRLDNFHAQNGTNVDGDIAIRDGRIRGAGYDANLAGRLSAEGETATVTGTVNGDFSGRNAQIADGVINARLQSPGAVEFISGEMILKR